MRIFDIVKLLSDSAIQNFKDLQWDNSEAVFHRSLWNLGSSVNDRKNDWSTAAMLPSQPARMDSHHAASFLSSIQQTIGRVRDRQTLFEEVCRLTVVEGGAQLAWIGRPNPQTGSIETIAKAGFPTGAVRGRVGILYGEEKVPAMQEALNDRRGMLCNDIERDGSLGSWRAEGVRRGFRSVAMFPLVFEGGGMGCFAICSAQRGFFDSARTASLLQVASDVAAGVQALGSNRIPRQAGCFRESDETLAPMAVIRMDTTERPSDGEEIGWAQALNYYIDSSPLAVVRWDQNFGVGRWSPRAEAMFGWTADELIGGSTTQRTFFHAEEWPAFENAMIDLLGGGKRCASVSRNYTKDGRTIYCEWHNSAEPGRNGEAATILSFVRDITEERVADEELSKSGQRFRALSSRVEQLREEERTRISREIHDVLGQMLTCIKLNLGWIEKRLDEYAGDRDLNPIVEKLIETSELADTTLDTMQHIASDLRPGILDKLGLAAALKHEARRFENSSGTQCRVEIDGDLEGMTGETTTALFRIFQEALTNVARHAHATKVEVELWSAAQAFNLEVRDNGVGIPLFAAEQPSSLGLIGMQERARLLGGHFRLSRRPDGGTIVGAVIPKANHESKDIPATPWLGMREELNQVGG